MVAFRFSFGPWFKDDAGDVRLFPIMQTEAQSTPEGVVIFRAAVLKHESHLKEVQAGASLPDVLQLSISPYRARLFASQLLAAADRVDGKVTLSG